MVLFTSRVPLPKMKRKKGDVIVTLNNVSRWYRYGKTEIKNTWKQELKEMYLPDSDMEHEYLTVKVRIVRNNNRTIDQDGLAFAYKWLMDTIEEMGYINNDKNVSLQTFPTIVDKTQKGTLLEVRVTDDAPQW